MTPVVYTVLRQTPESASYQSYASIVYARADARLVEVTTARPRSDPEAWREEP